MADRLATSSVFNKSFLRSRRGSVNLVPEKFASVVVSRMYLTVYGRLYQNPQFQPLPRAEKHPASHVLRCGLKLYRNLQLALQQRAELRLNRQPLHFLGGKRR